MTPDTFISPVNVIIARAAGSCHREPRAGPVPSAGTTTEFRRPEALGCPLARHSSVTERSSHVERRFVSMPRLQS